RTALLGRLGAGSCRGPRCRPGKLGTSAQRTGTFPQATTGELGSYWRSRADQDGSWRQNRRIRFRREGDRRESEREGPDGWPWFNRDPCPSDGADGRTRPRHLRLAETALDTVRKPA